MQFTELIKLYVPKQCTPKRSLQIILAIYSKKMPYVCCVPGCSNSKPTFKFPQDPETRLKWRIAIQRANQEGTLWEPPSKHHRVCRDHFTVEDFEEFYLWNQRLRLKKDAVPSVFEQSGVEIPVHGPVKKRLKTTKDPNPREDLADECNKSQEKFNQYVKNIMSKDVKKEDEEESSLQDFVKSEPDTQISPNTDTESKKIWHQVGNTQELTLQPGEETLTEDVNNKHKEKPTLQTFVKSEPSDEIEQNGKIGYQSKHWDNVDDRTSCCEETSVEDEQLKSKAEHFQCKQCNVVFSLHAEFQLHIKSHHKVKSYKCGYCGRIFNGFSFLKSHMRIHTWEATCKGVPRTSS